MPLDEINPWWWRQRQSPKRWKLIPYRHGWSSEKTYLHLVTVKDSSLILMMFWVLAPCRLVGIVYAAPRPRTTLTFLPPWKPKISQVLHWLLSTAKHLLYIPQILDCAKHIISVLKV
jgi:hypothetical protein